MVEELILRYRERLKVVFKFPSPYYNGKTIIEYQEIQQKIKELEKMIKKY